jgi:hypothetical protein
LLAISETFPGVAGDFDKAADRGDSSRALADSVETIALQVGNALTYERISYAEYPE